MSIFDRDQDPRRWYVELDGRRVAVLSDPRQVEMFWWSYAIEALDADPTINDEQLWEQCRFSFREHETQRLITGAFAAGGHDVSSGRVLIRALLTPARLPRPLSRFRLWLTR